MKKYILTLIALILILPLNAGNFKDALSAAIAPGSDKYFLKVKGFRPSSKMPEGPSFWDGIVSFFTSEEDEAKQRAVADYIYNMYIIEAAKGVKKSPAYLDTSYTGALDPIYRSDFKSAFEVKTFYGKHLAKINNLLKEDFKNYKYNPAEKTNAAQQNAYINMLVNTYSKNRSFSYLPGAAALSKTALNSARMEQLKKQISTNNAKNKNLSVIYSYIDPMTALDNATRTGGKTNATTYTYRPLSEECAACSYSFCKDICTATENKYAAYKLIRVYELLAKPRAGFLKDKNGKDRFVSSYGKSFPQWDYHVASLLVFAEKEGPVFVVVDTILEKEPVSYEHWLSLFDKSNTYFSIKPFIRSKDSESKIMKTSDMPRSYKPHDIRK